MKTYNVTITAKGSFFRGNRQKYAVKVEANDKDQAREFALNIAERDLKNEQYDSLHAGKTVVAAR